MNRQKEFKFKSKISMVLDYSEEKFNIDMLKNLEKLMVSSFPNILKSVFIIGLDITTIEKGHKDYLRDSIFKGKLLIILDNKYEDVIFKKIQAATVSVDYFGELDGEFFDADAVVYGCLKEKFQI